MSKPSKNNEKLKKTSTPEEIATVCDLTRFTAPCKGEKVILQELWTAGLSWDDKLPDLIEKKKNYLASTIGQFSINLNPKAPTVL